MHVSYPMRTGCRARSVHLRPGYLAQNAILCSLGVPHYVFLRTLRFSSIHSAECQFSCHFVWRWQCDSYLVNLQIFVLTGYPFDLPSGSLGSYCIYEYHLVISLSETLKCSQAGFLWLPSIASNKKWTRGTSLSPCVLKPFLFVLIFYNSSCKLWQPCSIGFATGGSGRTFFLWGGCMMVHNYILISGCATLPCILSNL